MNDDSHDDTPQRESDDRAAEREERKAKRGRGAIRESVNAAVVPLHRTKWPHGYEMRADGLYRTPTKDDQLPTRLCGPFEVLGETSPETSDDWGLLLRWRDKNSVEHEWIMPRALLAGESVIVREYLSARGLYVTTSQGARQHLTDCLARVESNARVWTVPRVGWHTTKTGGAVFVLPGRAIGPARLNVLRLNMETPPTIYAQQGTLAEWRERVARLAIKNSRLAFGVSAAFAAPLLWVADFEGGGINLRGESSKGKTTIIDGAASVWGAPSKTGANSFVRPWRATLNGLEGVATQHNHVLLPMDEMGEADPRELGESLYMLANGAGKERARAAGGNRRVATWTTLILSSSEQSAATLAAQAGRQIKAGQEVRLLDVPAVVPGGFGCFEHLHGSEDGAAFSQRVREATKRQHGTAGPAFVEWIAARLPAEEDFRDALASRLAAWRAVHVPPGADGQVIRAGRRMALVAIAGELATEAGLTGWPPGEAERAAGAVFRDWLIARGTTGAREEQNLLAALRRFVALHGASRFETVRDPDTDEIGAQAEPPLPDGARVLQRAGWRWQEVNEKGERRWVYGIVPEVFAAEVAQSVGMEEREARAKLGQGGFIRGRVEGGKTRWTIFARSIPGVGRPRLVVVEPRTIEGADE